MSLKKGNRIRTILLVKISNELESNKLKKSKLKINSKTSFEIGRKYSNNFINIDFPTETNTNQINYHYSNNLNNFKNDICCSPDIKISDVSLDYLKKENNRIDSAFNHCRRKRFISKNYDNNNIIINDNNNKNDNQSINNHNHNINVNIINSLNINKNKLELLSIKYLRKLAKLFKNVSLFEKTKKINKINQQNFNSEKKNNKNNDNDKNIDKNNNKHIKLSYSKSNLQDSIIHLKRMKHLNGSKEKKSKNLSYDNLNIYKSLSHEADTQKKHRKRNSLFSKKDYKNSLTENNISTEVKHSLFLIEKTNNNFKEDNLEKKIYNLEQYFNKNNNNNNNNSNSERNRSMKKIKKSLNIL